MMDSGSVAFPFPSSIKIHAPTMPNIFTVRHLVTAGSHAGRLTGTEIDLRLRRHWHPFLYAARGSNAAPDDLLLLAQPYAQRHATATILALKNTLDWLLGDADMALCATMKARD
jgi:hypothetical protein